MEIREAALADLPELTVLFNDYRLFYRKQADLPAARRFLEDRILKKDSVIYVAVDKDGSLAGFTQLYPLWSSTRMRRLWLLNDLYMQPSSRGKGISKLIIDKCKVLCRDTDACGLMLETEMSNTIGNNLYPATGFVLDEEHNYYFWDID